MARRKLTWDPHVRIYKFEMELDAWSTLSVDSRALLIELRALYHPRNNNIVFLSVREAMRRLNIGQRRVQAAFKELIDKGWISIHQVGSFHFKHRHATSFALENYASAPGKEPRKLYARWKSPSKTLA